MSILYLICNYYIKWSSHRSTYVCFAEDDLDNLISIVEYIYQKQSRIQEKPKIICRSTGLTVYE